MWKHLKNWIRAATVSGSNHRRAAQTHWRGQFEQLETRTVLSAAIGVAPADLDAGIASSWDGAYAQTGLPQHYTPNAIATRENSSPQVADRLPNGFREIGRTDPFLIRVVSNAPPFQTRVYLVFLEYHIPPAGPAAKSLQLASSPLKSDSNTVPPPLAATSGEPAAPSNRDPIAAASPYGGSQSNPSPSTPLQARAPAGPTGPFLSLLGSPNASTDSATSSSTMVAGARDTAFRSFPSESLLLAASVDELEDADFGLLGDDLEALSDQASDDPAESIGLGLGDGVAPTFDTLRSELNAIDAVLAELHDVDNRTERQDGAATTDVQRQNSAVSVGEAENARAAAAQNTLPGANETAQGGMVLLEPNGDANLCAYDLTALFGHKFQESVELPLGVEVSVGIYQALDIGGNELHPTANSTGSVAPASAAARPTISAESAPHEGSERAS